MSTSDLQDLDSIDLAAPTVWDDGPPYELFARMQREAPVHFSPQNNAPGEGGFWSITRFDDIRAISRDHKTFSSERRGVFNVDDMGVPLDLQRLQLISMDPPRHDRLKALVVKAFTPERVAAHENAINKIISRVLDSVADRERFDLVADVARPIPARVIGSMLGTPPEDDEKLVHWTNVFTAFEDPVIREQWKDTPAVVNEIVEYVNNQLAQRRGSAGDQLLDAGIQAPARRCPGRRNQARRQRKARLRVGARCRAPRSRASRLAGLSAATSDGARSVCCSFYDAASRTMPGTR